MDTARSKMQPDDSLAEFFSQGGSLRLLGGMDNDHLDKLYRYAGQLFDSGEFTAARNIYHLLSNFDHWNAEFLLGLALSHQRLGAHELALHSFSRAGAIIIDDPRPAFFAAISYQQSHNPDYACKALHAAMRWCGDLPHYQEIRDHAANMLLAIEGGDLCQ